MIKKNKIPTLDEDGFLNLIDTRYIDFDCLRHIGLTAVLCRRGVKDLDEKYIKKQKEEEKKIKEAAKAIQIDPR